MATQKPQIEQLPLVIEGKTEMVPARQYYNHKAQTLTIKYKSDIKKKDVEAMVKMIADGKELEEGNEEVWTKVYADVKEDIELAQDKVQEQIAAEEEAARIKKEQEEAKDAGEKALVNFAANVDVAATMASLGDLFDLGQMDRCVPKGDVSDEQLMGALVVGMKMDNFTNWAKGDLVAELEKRGHENAMTSLCEQTGTPYKSIYKMAVTAREVPPDMRKPGVSFTTYAEIASAKFSEDPAIHKSKMEEIVGKIGEKPAKTGDEKADAAAAATVITTAQEARAAVKAAQGKTVTPPDPNKVDLDKDTFFIVSHDLEDLGTKVCTGFPTQFAGDDIEKTQIIHARTARYMHTYSDKKGPSWTPLDKYEHPKPAPAEPEKPAAAAKKPAAKAAAAAPATPAKKGGGKKK